jgi:plasmid stability protein
LTGFRMHRMVFHMKTTLTIDDGVMRRLKAEAARRRRTMSDLVEAALRAFLRTKPDTGEAPKLPSFESGGALVDIADRTALYEAMEGR